MAEILSRLDEKDFQVVFFGDDTILNREVEEWPICDVVIAFFSKGYPLPKAKQYVALRKPFILNDLEMQEVGAWSNRRNKPCAWQYATYLFASLFPCLLSMFIAAGAARSSKGVRSIGTFRYRRAPSRLCITRWI